MDFAFWLQNELKFIGEPGTEGGQLLEGFLKTHGLRYSDEDEESDFDRCMRIGEVIKQYFSRPIPIVVHELEYYDEVAVQTRSANPPGLAKEFED